jgi:hypothetical protein
LIEEACATLRDVTLHEDNEARCGAAGGVEVVLEVLRRHLHVGPASLMERACGALWNITDDAGNRDRCVAARGVETVLNVLRRHRDGPEALLVEVCGALENVCGSPAGRAKCGAANGVEIMLDLLRRRRGDALSSSSPSSSSSSSSSVSSPLLEHACGALRSITTDSAANMSQLRAAGGAVVVRLVLPRLSTAWLDRARAWVDCLSVPEQTLPGVAHPLEDRT